MCEYSRRLVAWLDHELPDGEATNVERHVAHCAECRQAATRYAEVSGAFLDCYETAIVLPRSRNWRAWTFGSVAAAAVIAAIVIVLPRTETLSIHVPAPPPAPSIAFETFRTNEPIRPALTRPAITPVVVHAAARPQWIALEPTVEVALPADALFPPGAVPQGFSFIADVRPY